LDFLPLKLSDDIRQKAKLIYSLDDSVLDLLYEVVLSICRILLITYKKVTSDPHYLYDYSSEGSMKRDKINEIRKVVDGLSNYMEYLNMQKRDSWKG
jgi:hypothetical protein